MPAQSSSFDLWELLAAALMGVVQGATEFLPVSSSGHLRLGAHLFGVGEPELLFDIFLHVGTLVAVCAVYHRDLVRMARDLWVGVLATVTRRSLRAGLEHEGARLALLIVIASVPTATIGLVLDDIVEDLAPLWVGVMLIVNGGILLLSRLALSRRAKTAQDGPLTLWGISVPRAVIIGIAQGLAVMPGISRSGSTITTALFAGVDREQAARFSFLCSLPAILGAVVLKFDTTIVTEFDPSRVLRYGLGAVVAAVVGYLCLILLLRLLRKAQFHHFAWYCFAVGAVAIFVGVTM